MSYYRQGPFRPGGPGGMSFGVPSMTPYVRAIMIACGVVWFVQFVLYVGEVANLAAWFGLVPGRVIQGWIWQLGTYLFLHSPISPFHIVFNMLMLWMFGGELERYWGSRGFLRYYLVCGIGAGVFALASGLLPGRNPWVPTIGASGAIFGLLIAYGMVFAERPILFMLIFPMKARTMAMLMFALTFFSTIGQPGGAISHISHLGGAIVGFLYLKRAWRVGELFRELRWKLRRRRFKVMQSDDNDPWLN